MAAERRSPSFCGPHWCAACLALVAVGREHPLGMVFERVLVWLLTAAFLGLGARRGRCSLRGLAGGATVVYAAMWLGFPLPRIGHSHTTDYTINGEHMAERCLLFVTIALGESIIITGTNFGDLPNSTERWAALAAAFVGSAAIWWTYFDRGAEAGREIISSADDPGRLGLIAYTYCHIPIVAGIIVAAAGDEIAIAHPGQEVVYGRGRADPGRSGALPGGALAVQAGAVVALVAFAPCGNHRSWCVSAAGCSLFGACVDRRCDGGPFWCCRLGSGNRATAVAGGGSSCSRRGGGLI